MGKIKNYQVLYKNVKHYFEMFEEGLQLELEAIKKPYEGIDGRFYDFVFLIQKPLIQYRITSPTGTNPHCFSISSIQEFEDLFGSK